MLGASNFNISTENIILDLKRIAKDIKLTVSFRLKKTIQNKFSTVVNIDGCLPGSTIAKLGTKELFFLSGSGIVRRGGCCTLLKLTHEIELLLFCIMYETKYAKLTPNIQ